jgi:hypothetical protein
VAWSRMSIFAPQALYAQHSIHKEALCEAR